MTPLPFPNTQHDFELVRTKTGRGLYASASSSYKDAIFGRDSLEAAEDILRLQPDVAREVIVTMAWLQGVKHDLITEEEPGRIHHEYRNLVMDGQPINFHSEVTLHLLAEHWGGTDQEVLYYGTVDATPLYIRLVAKYCLQEGSHILDQAVERKQDGQTVTIRDSVTAALDWLAGRVTSSSIGLVEFCRTNPAGHAYQVWKDGGTSYMHLDGSRADFTQPIASIEVQGLAYDALKMGAALLGGTRADAWLSLAGQIQRTVLENFWLPDQHYFAEALDRDKSGRIRQVASLTCNPAEALDTGLFEDLAEVEATKFVGGIAEMIVSDQFLTEVGIRCRAKQHVGLVSFIDYHGAWAVWTKATYDIARGLRRHHFDRLADQIEIRILNGVRISGRNYEFWMVDPHGRVDYNPDGLRPRSGQALDLPTIHVAEDIQAWTISAMMAIEDRLAHPATEDRVPEWVRNLEDQLLQTMPRVELVQTPEQAEKKFPNDFYFDLNTVTGRDQRREFIHRQEVLEGSVVD